MQCINCPFYITAKETGDQPGCVNDGDVTNPDKDINCAVAGNKELLSRGEYPYVS